ncbi:MAG: peptidoglycan-binding protein [Pseudomonadota bacterium]
MNKIASAVNVNHLIWVSTLVFMVSPTITANALEQDAIRAALEPGACVEQSLNEAAVSSITAAYESRDYKPVWISDGKPNPQAARLLAELQRSSAHGLKPGFYGHEALSSLASDSDGKGLACFETGLSASFVMYANDMANGYVRKDEWPQHTIVAPVLYDASTLFDAADQEAGFQEFFKTLLTTDDRYVRLISKLTEFLRIEARQAWPEVRNIGSSQNPAADPDKVKSLLLFSGDLEQKDLLRLGSEPQLLRQAIARFQSRHGLDTTGRVDLPTIRAMETPVSEKISQIRINLERRRWQNRDLGASHVYINMADQSVRLVRDDEKEGSARISNAEGLEKLPTFSGQVTGLRISDNGELVFEIASDVSVGFFGGKLKAEFPVSGDPQGHLQALLGSSETEPGLNEPGDYLDLNPPIDAFVTYVTAWANKDGSVSFRPDVFDRDKELSDLLGFTR